MKVRIPISEAESDTLFAAEIPVKSGRSGMITPVGSAAIAAWAADQIKKVVIRHRYGRWEAECPVCADVLYRTTNRSALWRAMELHLTSYPPFGLEFLKYKAGDQILFNGEPYEVESGPHRPRVAPYRQERRHVFYLVIRNLSSGSLWQTSHEKAGELRLWREQ